MILENTVRTNDDEDPLHIGEIFHDLNLLLRHNQTLIIVIVFILFIVSPLAKEWRSYRMDKDHAILNQDDSLIIVQGENPDEANVEYLYKREIGNFDGKYLSVFTADLPKDGFIQLKYHFAVPKSGRYKLFVAGSHPGARVTGNFKYYSPYEISVDEEPFIDLEEEKKIEDLKKQTGSTFYAYYAYAPNKYFTKVGEFNLTSGNHILEFRINETRKEDDYYVFSLDAIFIVPEGWEIKERLFSYPSDMFSY